MYSGMRAVHRRDVKDWQLIIFCITITTTDTGQCISFIIAPSIITTVNSIILVKLSFIWLSILVESFVPHSKQTLNEFNLKCNVKHTHTHKYASLPFDSKLTPREAS